VDGSDGEARARSRTCGERVRGSGCCDCFLAHRESFPAQDPFRCCTEAQLLSKLYDIGVLNDDAKMSDIENKLTVAAFHRRPVLCGGGGESWLSVVLGQMTAD
jgi:hypothetical protein